MIETTIQTQEERLSDLLSRITISEPDADGLIWLAIQCETALGSTAIPADSIQGQAFAEFKAMLQKMYKPKLVRADNA